MIRYFNIPVSIIDKRPNRYVDISLFDPEVFIDLVTAGMRASWASILRCASIHYKGKNRTLENRIAHVSLDLENSLKSIESGRLILAKENGTEHEGRSTELISVGLCILLASRLFGVNFNRFRPILGTGKRMDFDLVQSNLSVVKIEAKGRQKNIARAIHDIFKKKEVSGFVGPQYGFLSMLPRESGEAHVYITDPQAESKDLSQSELIMRILRHYADVADLCGFWRMALKIRERIKALLAESDVYLLSGVPLEYSNVYKVGRMRTYVTSQLSAHTFVKPNDAGYTLSEKDDRIARFALEDKIASILDQQDYEELLSYTLGAEEDFIENGIQYSCGNDGCVMVIT